MTSNIIGLYCLDNTKFPNYALMCISGFYKAKGYTVEWYDIKCPGRYHKVYCSSCFTYSDKSWVTPEMICGGTGFDKSIQLPNAIAQCDPDYSIYPRCDYSVVWFDIGCPKNCPFCVNNNNHREIDRLVVNTNGNHIKVMDDNFFYGDWQRKMGWILCEDQPVDIQSVDVHTFQQEHAEALLILKHRKQIKMAWDNPRDPLYWKFSEISKWIRPYRIMVYVLIGYWSSQEEDLTRVQQLRNLGYDPFVMPYNKKDPYQKAFARWVNHKAIFKTVAWRDYKQGTMLE